MFICDEPSSSGVSPQKSRCSNFKKLFTADINNEDDDFLSGYGHGIPHSFPLNQYFQSYLKKTTKEFKFNYAAYNGIVRNIYEIINQAIGGKPDKAFQDHVTKGIVREYSVLKCGGPKDYVALSTSIRKQANNYESKIKLLSTALVPVGNSSDSSLSKATFTTMEHKQLIIKERGIKEFFEEFPQMQDLDQVVTLCEITKTWC